MNTIDISTDRQWVEAWHNGQVIQRWHCGTYSFYNAIGLAQQHFRQWAGDTSPTIGKALQEIMRNLDTMLSEMSFGAQYK